MRKRKIFIAFSLIFILISCQSVHRYGCKGKRCVVVPEKATSVKVS